MNQTEEHIEQAEENETISQEEKNRGKLVIDWNIRNVFEIILKIHDALVGREGIPIPLSPKEISDLLQLKRFIDGSVNYALRRCICNTVYCRLPDKSKACALDPEEIIKDKSIVYQCKWRGKRL